MTLETLQAAWFILVAVLITGYALLDGFDLGIGSLHLFTKTEEERKTMFYTIGPFWDSNQVWLLTGGGAIFAAFPMVYATVFSGFYLALMLLLFALIFRAVSIEFQHLVPCPRWKRAWDWGFALGSILPSVLFGVAMGNILRGIPLDAEHNFTGSFFDLLNPYSLLLGLVSLAMFTMHGAAFLAAKTEGPLEEKARRWGRSAWLAYVPLFLTGTVWSYASTPRLFENFFHQPVLLVLPLMAVIGMVLYPTALKRDKWKPFMASALNILGVLGIAAASLFPYLVPSNPDLANSLTIYNASSSQLTLTVMLILALTGMPLVILYSSYIYKKFTGSAKTHPTVSKINFPG
ncbi:cytochrome d ubiquinol oxidase subunit II [Desulfohalotomaculum tongense]|uniref:cytochrome d ubiquinol oxidase subunit II n=1 Tax=Desulforadius tongensis TaxID=1216062 RepID=UPI001EE4FAC6|nr:cytochrome d ubiquinol oxidase subunit II [Desulforadius tongensis]MBM7854565.1 cytochrome d ubiquinol oxidase subunit II [Desulforadius tongensis]